MSWDCPYLKKDGSCNLRNKECAPLEKGCVIMANKQYKRLINKDSKKHPPRKSSSKIKGSN